MSSNTEALARIENGETAHEVASRLLDEADVLRGRLRHGIYTDSFERAKALRDLRKLLAEARAALTHDGRIAA